MKQIIRNLLRMLAISMLLLASVGNSYAQLNANAADCNELKDPDVMFQMDLCKAHAGCRLVMGIHNTCVSAKKFFTNLKEQVGEGVKSLFGYKKEVTSDMVFEASLSDRQRAVLQNKNWNMAVDDIKEGQKKTVKDVLSGYSSNNTAWTYIGDVSGGKRNGLGATFYSNGRLERGGYREDQRNGSVDITLIDGTRFTGLFLNDQMDGQGFGVFSDGTKYRGGYVASKMDGGGLMEFVNGWRYEGSFKENKYSGDGAMYRADGTVYELGIFKDGKLSVGKRYDTQSNVTAQIDKPRDEQKALEAKQQADAAQQRAEQAEKQVAEQRRRDAAAAADRDYRASLNSMNAGQLFAKADELSSNGDTAKAREVLRALVSRFPDHPLAAQAASQMAGMSSNQTNNANNGNGANAGSNNGAASNGSVPAVGGGKCWDVMAKREKEYEAINRRPTPAGATPPFMRVMWMTADSIKIIDTYCAGDAKAAKYRSELQLAYNQSKTACEQLSAGQCQPNPY
jgi:hypothetical protein